MEVLRETDLDGGEVVVAAAEGHNFLGVQGRIGVREAGREDGVRRAWMPVWSRSVSWRGILNL